MAHPLEQFHYCPRCGSAHFEEHDWRSKQCRDCGFLYYYDAAAATVCVMLNARRELLVCRRGRQPARGTLDLPGGFVDPGEGVDQGMLREIKEETGLDAVIDRFLFSLPNRYPFAGFEVQTADCFFLCSCVGQEVPRAADDAAALMWLPKSEIRPERFGLGSIQRGVARLLNEFPEIWE